MLLPFVLNVKGREIQTFSKGEIWRDMEQNIDKAEYVSKGEKSGFKCFSINEKGEIVKNICFVVIDVKSTDPDWSRYSKLVYRVNML